MDTQNTRLARPPELGYRVGQPAFIPCYSRMQTEREYNLRLPLEAAAVPSTLLSNSKKVLRPPAPTVAVVVIDSSSGCTKNFIFNCSTVEIQ